MNVLLTSVGRRSYLVEYFRDALAGRGKVVVTNTSGDSPGMQVADCAIVVPPSSSEDYIDQICAIIEKHEIRLLCSLHDLDGYILSKYKRRIEQMGVVALLPEPEWAAICLDKWQTCQVLKEAGFRVPWQTVSLKEARRAVEAGVVDFPLVVKARHGFGSLGLCVCGDLAELEYAHARVRRNLIGSDIGQFIEVEEYSGVLIQECLSGSEFCVEVLNDLEGNFTCHFAVQVHRMRAGESDSATTVDLARFEEMSRRFAKLSGHIGLWELDVMEKDGRDYVIEINPRFTGDYPFNHLAGADVPSAILAWLRGEKPDLAWFAVESGVRGYKDLVPKRSS